MNEEDLTIHKCIGWYINFVDDELWLVNQKFPYRISERIAIAWATAGHGSSIRAALAGFSILMGEGESDMETQFSQAIESLLALGAIEISHAT